jgi:hypothetical protein
VGHFRGSEKSRYSQLTMPFQSDRYLNELVRPKIKSEKAENFQRSNKRHLRTTIHHTITTNSPANYHQKTRTFSKPPSKTPVKNCKNSAPGATNIFLQILKTPAHLKTPRPKTSPGVRSKQHEPLFRCRKPNNRDVPHRSTV